eukprot:1808748-Lingulodinium_polyedra.AAC.1
MEKHLLDHPSWLYQMLPQQGMAQTTDRPFSSPITASSASEARSSASSQKWFCRPGMKPHLGQV